MTIKSWLKNLAKSWLSKLLCYVEERYKREGQAVNK